MEPKPSCNAFSLIELLVSMVVLSIVVLVMIRVFDEMSNASIRASGAAMRIAGARAALDTLSRDLETAVVDSRLNLYHEAEALEGRFDELFMITTRSDSKAWTNDSEYVQVGYYVTTLEKDGYTDWVLTRAVRRYGQARDDGADYFDNDPDNWSVGVVNQFDTNVVVDHVVRFRLYVCDEDGRHLLNKGTAGTLGGNAWYDSSVDMNRSDYPHSDPGTSYDLDTPPGFRRRAPSGDLRRDHA